VIDADAPRMGSPLVPPPPARWCVVFGNEDTGVRGPIRELCADHRVRINMAPGVDSLNIGVATGILLHWFADSDGRPGWLGEDG
jgi:tRNA G18 (ribose-2'-O)-methylase SpoU